MKTYIFSWGGGVNSTAILAMIKLGMLPELTKDNTHIVFADTGAEMPYTYEHTSSCLQPMARDGWVCKSINPYQYPDLYSKRCKGTDLPQFYLDRHCFPTRMFRICTSEYKIIPLQNYKKSLGDNLVTILGIASEEKHRAKELGSEFTYYPLIDQNIDRDKCFELCKQAGLPVPQKSGCWCCPFQKRDQWLDLAKNYKSLYERCLEMEDNKQKHKPNAKFWLCGDKPLREKIKYWREKERQKCLDSQDLFDTNRHCLCEL